jgi:hypothetical protein
MHIPGWLNTVTVFLCIPGRCFTTVFTPYRIQYVYVYNKMVVHSHMLAVFWSYSASICAVSALYTTSYYFLYIYIYIQLNISIADTLRTFQKCPLQRGFTVFYMNIEQFIPLIERRVHITRVITFNYWYESKRCETVVVNSSLKLYSTIFKYPSAIFQKSYV